MRSGGNGDDEEDNRAEESPEFLFSPSIYEMVSPEELQEDSSGYAEDSTRTGNEETYRFPLHRVKYGTIQLQHPIRPKDRGVALDCLLYLREQRRTKWTDDMCRPACSSS